MSSPSFEIDQAHENSLLDRFFRYVQIDTEADPESQSVPSTEKQKNMSQLLLKECQELKLVDVQMTEHGYVYATVPGNTEKTVPTICFCAHVDTAPDCSGKDVKPLLHKSYQGQDIKLPDDPSQVINPVTQPHLGQHLGEDIITASGLTLLGADDKSGVAIIMELAHFLQKNPRIKHGDIRLLFTTDEEVGRGVDHVDMDLLGAKFGYTLDGGATGSFEDETFSADAATLRIKGVSAHPGYAKGKMEHAIKIAGKIIAALPQNHLTPESTEGREGFIHPTTITGSLEEAEIQFIIRDFDTHKLQEHTQVIEEVTEEVLKEFPNSSYTLEVKEQYRNMKEVVQHHPKVSEYAELAIERAGLTVRKSAIRGGTDGSRLSFMGMPCPNIFTGMHGIHSKQEWISLQDMTRSLTTLVHLVQIWEENA